MSEHVVRIVDQSDEWPGRIGVATEYDPPPGVRGTWYVLFANGEGGSYQPHQLEFIMRADLAD